MFAEYHEPVSIKVESSCEIIEKVKLFCEKRAAIQDDLANPDVIVLEKNLNEFDSKFRELNWIFAEDLKKDNLELLESQKSMYVIEDDCADTSILPNVQRKEKTWDGATDKRKAAIDDDDDDDIEKSTLNKFPRKGCF